jgi:ABC-type glycerol-3-phosphate transport system substrate-binding protein
MVALLAACGSQSSNTSGGKITITEMDYWSIASQSAILSKLFSDYEKLHPNVTIQRDAVPFANLIPKADQEAASHTLPNLIAMDNPDVAAFASTGALTQLDSYFPGQLNGSTYYAGPLQTTLYQNKTYSLPVAGPVLQYEGFPGSGPSASGYLERFNRRREVADEGQHVWFRILGHFRRRGDLSV